MLLRMDFLPAIRRVDAPDDDDLIALFADGELIVQDGPLGLPSRSTLGALVPQRTVHVGRLGGRAVDAAMVDTPPALPAGLSAEPLRGLHGRLADAEWSVAGRAFQLAEWDRTHRFCGACGTATERAEDERALVCPACGHRSYPRHSPAVIVRVTRADEVLLGRSSRFPPGMYSTLAGFVDPGESAEEAVRRELREEAGIEVGAPVWFGSQSWAFPHSLMLGFTADWTGGELVPDPDELEDLAWFTRDALPVLPPPASIARRLLDDWIGA